MCDPREWVSEKVVGTIIIPVIQLVWKSSALHSLPVFICKKGTSHSERWVVEDGGEMDNSKGRCIVGMPFFFFNHCSLRHFEGSTSSTDSEYSSCGRV